jgi:hypothetical protein
VTEPDAASEMRWRVKQEVIRHVQATGGQVGDRPISVRADYGTMHDAEPLAGVRAALAVQRAGANLVQDYIRNARSDGASWEQVGQALGLEADRDSGRSLGEEAYTYSAGRPTAWGHNPTVGFSCASCKQFITDRGPYESHPSDNEQGHAGNCARFGAEVATWQAQRDAEDAEWEAGE